MSPGHLWRDKWIALCGPPSLQRFLGSTVVPEDVEGVVPELALLHVLLDRVRPLLRRHLMVGVLNFRTTTLHTCAAVPRRARI